MKIHRWRVGAGSVSLALLISFTAPNYLSVQSAKDVAAFRRAVDEDGRMRVAAAGLMDVGFAASYSFFALSFYERSRRLSRMGTYSVLVGAANDLVENILLLKGVVRPRSLSERSVTAMRVCGTAKWAGIAVGALAIAADRCCAKVGPAR